MFHKSPESTPGLCLWSKQHQAPVSRWFVAHAAPQSFTCRSHTHTCLFHAVSQSWLGNKWCYSAWTHPRPALPYNSFSFAAPNVFIKCQAARICPVSALGSPQNGTEGLQQGDWQLQPGWMSSQDTACNLDFITIAAQVQKARGGLVRRRKMVVRDGGALMDHRGKVLHDGGG